MTSRQTSRRLSGGRRLEREAASRRFARWMKRQGAREAWVMLDFDPSAPEPVRCRVCDLQLPHVCLDGREI